jgi:hypothetical protein
MSEIEYVDEETGTVRDDPWLVGSYARYDVDQEDAVIIAFSRRLRTLAVYVEKLIIRL